MRKDLLKSIIIGESRAYGFTIAFWGSGALLIGEFGVPSPELVFLYASGAIIGFGLVTMIAFSSVLKETEKADSGYLALSMIHYLAALGPLGITYLLTSLDASLAFLISGASVSVLYNLLQLVEDFMSEQLRQLEKSLEA